ncbi:MAG: CHAD domain-containing protein [Pirellulales bacterium]
MATSGRRIATPARVWEVADDPQTPVRSVAIRTLRKRLEAVWSELAAACHDCRDPERIHQLRVATRRTLAAFDAFHDLVPVQSRECFQKWLRRIRRAAGNARDLDVLAERLARQELIDGNDCRGRPKQMAVDAESTPAGLQARRRLIAMLSRHRVSSHQSIHDVHERLLGADWPGHVEGLVDALSKGRKRQTFGDYARRRFKPLMERFFARADRRLRNADEIHRLRIEGKKLRYSLEIFATAFPGRVLSKCEKALESLQESLGEFTDHSAAADRLKRLSKQDGASSERLTLMALRKQEASHAARARKTFAKWWNPTRRRSLRRRFERTLRRRTA